MNYSIRRFYITQGDQLPRLELRVLRESTGEPFSFVGFSNFRFSMTLKGRTAPTVADGSTQVIGDPTQGMLQVNWGPSDTAIPGVYEAQVHCQDSSGLPLSIPNHGYIEVHIIRRV